MTISRRDMLKTTAAALALPALPQSPTPNPQPRFFTPAELALVDELTEMIIPADAQSGGARAAGVAAYIDGRLAEAFGTEGEAERTRWRDGLKRVEALAQEMHRTPFMASTPEQRLAVLTRMAAGEAFFKQIKGATIAAYYTSQIGIHDDQQYKGNVYQTGEYAGSDPT